MSDTEVLDPAAGLPPVPLLANSYSLDQLIAASDHVVELKTIAGREANLASIPEKLALNQDVVANQAAPDLPPDHVLRNVTDASGTVVRAPVPVLEGGFTDDEPALPDDAGISAGGASDVQDDAVSNGATAEPTEGETAAETGTTQPRRKRATTTTAE